MNLLYNFLHLVFHNQLLKIKDNNRDGYITDKEILRGVELMYEFKSINRSNEYSPEDFVRDIFKKMDKNGDKKLSKEEFIHECLNNQHVLSLLSPFEI
jgi:Ca2+-binding EF-hand superfamily protein